MSYRQIKHYTRVEQYSMPTKTLIPTRSIDEKLDYTTLDYTKIQALTKPSTWGPSVWFMLHNGAAKYPIVASKLCRERMKGFILGLPMMLPCSNCRKHATNYIESHRDTLDVICQGRKSVFEFFVDFHNDVNARFKKKIYSYQDAAMLFM